MGVPATLAGHRVEAAGVPGVALAQSLYRQTGTAQAAVSFHRLTRVLLTGRIEPALIPQPGAQYGLVHTQGGQQKAFHVGIRS